GRDARSGCPGVFPRRPPARGGGSAQRAHRELIAGEEDAMTQTTPTVGRTGVSWLLIVPAMALMVIVLFVPLSASFYRSISTPTWTLEHYVALFTDGVTLTVLGRTVMTAAIVTVSAFLIGYPY